MTAFIKKLKKSDSKKNINKVPAPKGIENLFSKFEYYFMQKISTTKNVFKWAYELFVTDYRVDTCPALYITASGIIMLSFKSIGQF